MTSNELNEEVTRLQNRVEKLEEELEEVEKKLYIAKTKISKIDEEYSDIKGWIVMSLRDLASELYATNIDTDIDW